MSAATVHPEHRQGDIQLADGSRVFTCTKTLRDNARAAMLLIPYLFRLDVRSHDDSFDVQVRNLSRGKLDTTLSRPTERGATSFDDMVMKITEFTVTPVGIGIGPISVSICLPATERIYEYPCTAMAVVPPTAA